MKHLYRSLSLTTAAVFAVTVLAVAPVFAERGSDDTNGSGGNASGRSSKTVMSDDSNEGSEVESEHTADTTKTRQKVEDFKKNAHSQLEQKRKEVKGKTAEQRKKVCESRANGINKRFTNFGTVADRHLAKIDGAYEKLQAYQAANKLDADNYDALVAVADAKQQTAVDAIAALKLVNTTIDCSSTDPAAAIAEVKAAVKTTREALKDYRKSVKAILVELRTAKAAAQPSTDSDGDDSTNGSTDDTNTTTTPTENQ